MRALTFFLRLAEPDRILVLTASVVSAYIESVCGPSKPQAKDGTTIWPVLLLRFASMAARKLAQSKGSGI